MGDPLRGPYLSWLVYNDAVFDPLTSARFHRWEYDPRGVSYGRFEDAVRRIETTLSASPI